MRACQHFLLLCSNGGCRRLRAIGDAGESVIEFSPRENFGDGFQGHNMPTTTNFVDRAPRIFVIFDDVVYILKIYFIFFIYINFSSMFFFASFFLFFFLFFLFLYNIFIIYLSSYPRRRLFCRKRLCFVVTRTSSYR